MRFRVRITLMPRAPKPYYWQAKKAWYATIDRRRHRLAAGPDARDEAFRRFHELMAQRGRGDAPAGDLLVGEVLDAYALFVRRERSPRTAADADRFLAPFAKAHGRLLADDLRPHHVTAWLDARPRWGPHVRRHAIAVLHAAFNRAVRQGLLERSPIARLERPTVRPRPVCVGAADLSRILPWVRSEEFRDYLVVLADTGCRPGELDRLEARHLRHEARAAVLEGKTTRRTGRMRTIWFTARAWALVISRAERRPAGPLFLTAEGRAWRADSRSCQVRAINARARKEKVELGRWFGYALRHGWITDGLQAGATAEQLAAAAGNSAREIERTYDHLAARAEAMRQVIERVRPAG